MSEQTEAIVKSIAPSDSKFVGVQIDTIYYGIYEDADGKIIHVQAGNQVTNLPTVDTQEYVTEISKLEDSVEEFLNEAADAGYQTV